MSVPVGQTISAEDFGKLKAVKPMTPTPGVGSTVSADEFKSLSQPKAPEKPQAPEQPKEEGGIMEGLAKLGHALSTVKKTAVDVQKGFDQQVGKTVTGVHSIAEKAINAPAKLITGRTMDQAIHGDDVERPTVGERARQSAGNFEAQNTAQKVGQGIEMGAEFLAPGGAGLKVSSALAKGAVKAVGAYGSKIVPKLVRGAADVGSRSLVEGTLLGGQTAAKEGGLTPEVMTQAKFGAAIPVAGTVLKGVSKVVKPAMGKTAEATINSLVKPLLKDFSYGKNPGRGVAAEGIVANSLDDLAGKIFERKAVRGKEIGEKVAQATAQGRKVNLPNFTAPIDEALEQARKAPRTNEALIKRLEDTKKDILGVKETITGMEYPTRSFFNLTPDEVWKFKQSIYDITKYTGNVSDDKVVNMALKKMGGTAKQALNDAVPGLAPLNERFADLSSAQIATIYRDKIEARQNMLKFAPKLLGGAGLISGVATGDIGPIVTGAVIAGADAIAASPAFKTRLAKVLSSMSGDELAQVYSKTPAFKSIVERVFGKDARKFGEADFAPGPGAAGSQMVGKEVPKGVAADEFGGLSDLSTKTLEKLKGKKEVPKIKVYHGTGSEFMAFNDSLRGSVTQAKSAHGAIWFTDDIEVARAYATYAAEEGPIKKILAEADIAEKVAKKSGKAADWEKVDALVKKSEELAGAKAYSQRRKLASIRESDVSGEFLEVDAHGKTPQELSKDGNIDSWLNSQIERAKSLGKDGLKIKNLDDTVGLVDKPSTHYAIFDSKGVEPLRSFRADAIKGQSAVNELLRVRSGELPGAFSHPEIGKIDLIWGKAGEDGYGLAKIESKHPEVLPHLEKIISKGKIIGKPGTRAKLAVSLDEKGDHLAIIGLDFKGDKKSWLLTSYQDIK